MSTCLTSRSQLRLDRGSDLHLVGLKILEANTLLVSLRESGRSPTPAERLSELSLSYSLRILELERFQLLSIKSGRRALSLHGAVVKAHYGAALDRTLDPVFNQNIELNLRDLQLRIKSRLQLLKSKKESLFNILEERVVAGLSLDALHRDCSLSDFDLAFESAEREISSLISKLSKLYGRHPSSKLQALLASNLSENELRSLEARTPRRTRLYQSRKSLRRD